MAMIHFNTTNKSALQLYQLLKDIGVKNNKMHLVLLDEGLADIDPLDDNLAPEYADRVLEEIDRNPWYYYREIARVPIEDGTKVRFRFDIASYASIQLKFLGFDLYVEKPRQTGKTVEAMMTTGLSFNLLSENSAISLFNHDDKKVKANLNEMKLYLEALPRYMQLYKYDIIEKDGLEIVKELPESGKSVSTVINKISNNTILAATAGNTEEVAAKAGRGAKTKEVVMDEVGYCKYIDITWNAAIPAFQTASSNAKSGGRLSYFQVMSTPPDIKTRQGKYLNKVIKTDALKFEPYMLDMSPDEIRGMMNAKQTGWIYITFQYNELGFDEAWAYRAFIKMSKEEFRRDYLLQWAVDFTDSPFDVADLERLQDMARTKRYKAIRFMENYDFKVYEYNGMSPEDTLRYFYNRNILIGCDTATGLGGDRDSSTAVGSCPETGKTIFTFKNNTLSTKEFANILMYFIQVYFRKGLLIIERNTTGVIDTIRGTKFEKYMYYTPLSKDQMERGIKGHIANRFIYGIYQIAQIRDVLYNDMLINFVKNNKNILDCEDIVSEICTLVYNNKNKIDHDKGCHDDIVMGKLLSLFPMLYDKMFQHRFGIKKGSIENDLVSELGAIDNILSDSMDEIKQEVVEFNPFAPVTIDELADEMYYRQMSSDDAFKNITHNKGSTNLMDNWYSTENNTDNDDIYR